MDEKFDSIIIGAGFAGAVLAERLAGHAGKSVLLVDKKQYIGGHCRDYINSAGIVVQEHGPHIFHTEVEAVWNYLSQFTEWNNYRHEVLASVDNQMIPIPFNLNSLRMLFTRETADRLESKIISVFGTGTQVPILDLKKHSDGDLRNIGEFIYEKILLNYTRKQWGGMRPEELHPSVTSRVPFRISNDNQYFSDPYQGVPLNGYSPIFEKLLNHEKIDLRLGVEAKDIIRIKDNEVIFDGKPYSGIFIYTGMIDELFDFRFGKLPYRSLFFKLENVNRDHFQVNSVINYPNEHDFTRITEFKHFQKDRQHTGITTIAYEYPAEYKPGVNDPYYIIPKDENEEILKKYRRLADSVPNLIPLGRLAEYRYYNMDQVILRALDVYENLIPKIGTIFRP